jgi:hypothetical protein
VEVEGTSVYDIPIVGGQEQEVRGHGIGLGPGVEEMLILEVV